MVANGCTVGIKEANIVVLLAWAFRAPLTLGGVSFYFACMHSARMLRSTCRIILSVSFSSLKSLYSTLKSSSILGALDTGYCVLKMVALGILTLVR